jgi:hypothetical protein
MADAIGQRAPGLIKNLEPALCDQLVSAAVAHGSVAAVIEAAGDRETTDGYRRTRVADCGVCHDIMRLVQVVRERQAQYERDARDLQIKARRLAELLA